MRLFVTLLLAVVCSVNCHAQENEMLPEARLKKGVATVKVKMLGYKLGMNPIVNVGGIEPLADTEEMQKEVTLDSCGYAVVELPLHLVRRISIWTDEIPFAQILVAPGETVECIIAPNAKGKDLYTFKGYMARTNNETFRTRVEANDGRARIETMYEFMRMFAVPETIYDALEKCSTPEERFDALAGMLNKRIADINNRTDLSDATKALMRMDAEGQFLQWIRGFDNNYLSLVVCLEKDSIPETMEGMQSLADKYKGKMPYEAYKDKLKAMRFEAFTAPYATCGTTYWTFFPGIIGDDEADVKLTQLETIYGFKQTIRGFDNDRMFDRYTKHIIDPVYIAMINDFRAEQKRKAEQAKSMDNIHYGKLDDVAPEDVLPTILGKYKGKVVLLDVWQTWCGPCRIGHKEMASVKEELKDKNVVFLYLSSPSSPLAVWQRMAGEIPGEHYRISQTQYNHVMDKVLESQGVPTYVIYDTDGTMKYKQIGFPGPDPIKAELLKVLE